jgi:hypothetical protein
LLEISGIISCLMLNVARYTSAMVKRRVQISNSQGF